MEQQKIMNAIEQMVTAAKTIQNLVMEITKAEPAKTENAPEHPQVEPNNAPPVVNKIISAPVSQQKVEAEVNHPPIDDSLFGTTLSLTDLGEWNGGDAVLIGQLADFFEEALSDTDTVKFQFNSAAFLKRKSSQRRFEGAGDVCLFDGGQCNFLIHRKRPEVFDVVNLSEIDTEEADISDCDTRIQFDMDDHTIGYCDDDGIEAEVRVDTYYDMRSLPNALRVTPNSGFTTGAILLLEQIVKAIEFYDEYGPKAKVNPGVVENPDD